MEDNWNEGEQSGMTKGMTRAVLSLLGARWKVSEELKARIMEEKDLEVLSRWNILAARAESIEAFEQQMGA